MCSVEVLFQWNFIILITDYNTIINMSKAAQNKNYIAKLKATSKYEDHKKKKAEKARVYRLKK